MFQVLPVSGSLYFNFVIDILSFDKTVCSFIPLLFLPFWVSGNSLSTMIKLFSSQRLLFYIHVYYLHGVYIWTYNLIFFPVQDSSSSLSKATFTAMCLLSVFFFAPSSQLGWDSLYLLLFQMYTGELVPPDCFPSFFHFQNNLDHFGTFMSYHF